MNSGIAEEVLAHAYTTTDFDMTAFFMSLLEEGRPVAQVVDIRTWRQGSIDGISRFSFVLTGQDGTDITKKLHQLELDYTNRKTVIEPIGYMASRKQLRTLLDRRKAELKQQVFEQRNKKVQPTPTKENNDDAK